MMLSCRDLNEHESERSKNHRLDEPDEHFEEHERERRAVRQQVRDNNEQHFAGKDVTEKTERERDHLGDFGNDLKNADERTNGVSQRVNEEFPGIFEKTQSGNAEKLDHDDGHDCQRERIAQIRVRGTKYVMTMILNRPDGQKGQPVVHQYEEKERSDESKEYLSFLVVTQSIGYKVVSTANNAFHRALEPTGNKRRLGSDDQTAGHHD